jgi:hypothetical protein
MPAGPDEKRFFAALLAALGTPNHINARLVHAAQESTVTLMRAAGVKLLVIDELHNVLAGTRDQQRRLLNLLRWLGNELQVPLVAVGTSDALHAIQSDDQLANRFKLFALPLWRAEAEFLRLLNTLEAVLPLRRPSGLSEPGLARIIMTAAEGLLGEITAFIIQAAVYAIRSGQECITRETLENVYFIPPSRRRHALE